MTYRRLHQAADLAALVSQRRLIRRRHSCAGRSAGRLRRHKHAGRHAGYPRDDARAPSPPAMTADEMDAMHEAGIKTFLAGPSTQGLGNQPLAPKIENGVKIFELTCAKTPWEVTAGQKPEAWAYNGQVPGPELRVTEGDTVRVIVKNELPESTAVHFHGVMVPNKMDGVPFITQPPIKPGQSFTYEFVARNPGSHMYHSHHNSTKQVGQGLLGAFIIEPKDKSKDPAFDLEHTMILNDQLGGFTINGKGFPATSPLTAKKGQKLRIRYMNEGQMIHPMHLHGLPQLVFAKDGWNLPQPFHVRYAERGAGRALGCDRRLYRARRVGVPLPHSLARRGRAWYVWHGHGAGDRGVIAS